MFTTDNLIEAEVQYRTERIKKDFGHHRDEQGAPVTRRKALRLRRAAR